MCEGNYIKLNRKIADWEWYDDPATKIVFLHFLLTANWQDKSWHGIEIKRGETLESLSSIAERNGLTIRNVRTAISHLIDTKSVTVRTAGKYSIYSICEYEKYQGRQEDRHEGDTNVTQKRHEGDTKVTPPKERKEREEGKKVRNTNPPIPPFQRFGEYGHVKLTAEQYEKLVNDFGQGTANGGIKVVDEYCEMSKKRYANYNLAIRKWGIDRAREDEKKNGSGSRAEVTPEQDYDDWCRRMAEIAGDNSGNLKSGSNDPFQ